jgi:uncharacterized protein
MAKGFLLLVLAAYRTLLSPWLPGACRFYPSCSVYATGAIDRYGVLGGLRLSLMRLLHCHPGHPGGYDPLP